MRTPIAIALLALPLLPAAASAAPAALGAPAQQLTEEEKPSFKDASDIELSFYRPKFNAQSLVQWAELVSAPTVSWNELSLNGGWITKSRARFVVMDQAIAVQDFPDGLAEAKDLLRRLDEELWRGDEVEDKKPDAQAQTTLRLARLSAPEADQLIRSTWPRGLTIGGTERLGLITLSGDAELVDKARALVEEADRPLPQLLMSWSLIEAVAPDELGDSQKAPEEIAKALQPLAPGKVFRRAGDFLVRGAAGGGAHLKIESSVSSLQGTTPKQPGDVSISVHVRGWEPESRQLHLNDCQVLILRQTGVAPLITSTNDRLTTDLSIREGETTVIGSLGSDHLFVALTVTVME